MNVILNAKIVSEHNILENHAVIFDHKVRAILPQEAVNLSEYQVTDGQGLYLSPGFIDIHKQDRKSVV